MTWKGAWQLAVIWIVNIFALQGVLPDTYHVEVILMQQDVELNGST